MPRHSGTDLEPVEVWTVTPNFEEHRNQHPILTKLAKIEFVIPDHSVGVKSNTKTASLHETWNITDDYAMQASIEGPPISELPFDETFEKWTKKSRIIFMTNK